MTADLVYLGNFLNPKIYFNFYQKKLFILACKSHLSHLTSSTPRNNPMFVGKRTNFSTENSLS